MKQYIVNLTNNLIGNNRYYETFRIIKDRDEFIKHIKLDLEIGSVQAMSYETLGKIMCSFESGDVMTVKKDFFADIYASFDGETILRELVCLYLASVIFERFQEEPLGGVIKWRNTAA